jgi:putative hydrolase of the HAD superfamily
VTRRLVWFFDLDGTLHDASHAIFAAIDARMTDYVERHLVVDREQANQLRLTYWRRYGATLLGLIRHHAIDPHHFLRETHDFDVASLLRAERGLAQLFARLPGRKVLLTNAPSAYAESVLAGINLHRQIGARYSIESMRVHGTFRPKPSRAMLRYMLARERVARGAAILVEDSAPNLRAARAAGFRTVLIRRGGRRGRANYVGLRVASIRDLPRALVRLRA